MEVTEVQMPRRRALIRRGRTAKDYFAYCEEVGCGVWSELLAMGPPGEPFCMWLPDNMIEPGTSMYVQGIALPHGFTGETPAGYDIIILPATTYLEFRGQPFADEDFAQAIGALRAEMEAFDPALLGYAWDDSKPRIQLEPIGARGYVELRAVSRLASA